MNEKQPKYSKAFHSFMIFFFLWAQAAFAVLYGVKTICEGQMNGHHGMELALIIIVNALLIALGLFTVKARFDLAAYRAAVLWELPGIYIAGALLCLANYWVEDFTGDNLSRSLILTAVILLCWGIALYRYYRQNKELFIN